MWWDIRYRKKENTDERVSIWLTGKIKRKQQRGKDRAESTEQVKCQRNYDVWFHLS